MAGQPKISAVGFSEADLAADHTRGQLSLIGRFFSVTPPARARIQHIVNNVWTTRNPVSVLDADQGLFQFVFGNEADLKETLRRSPWYIKSNIITLQMWRPPTVYLYNQLARVLFTVQIWGMPPSFRTVAVGQKLAEQLGPVKETALYAIRQDPGYVVKARVMLDITVPLVPRLEAQKIREDGVIETAFWSSLRYERLPVYCFYCGVMGHNIQLCRLPKENKEAGSDYRFGPELKGDIGGHKIDELTLQPIRHDRRRQQRNVWRNPNSMPLLLPAPPVADNTPGYNASGHSTSQSKTAPAGAGNQKRKIAENGELSAESGNTKSTYRGLVAAENSGSAALKSKAEATLGSPSKAHSPPMDEAFHTKEVMKIQGNGISISEALDTGSGPRNQFEEEVGDSAGSQPVVYSRKKQTKIHHDCAGSYGPVHTIPAGTKGKNKILDEVPMPKSYSPRIKPAVTIQELVDGQNLDMAVD
ncbi:unnamed protein product [Linum trigynum]|uniref:DUF4283 domain-containing protein n=1 Tax=Linum trigynum TaxID=586398 RepID=A0AAV2D271_9ROSI